MNRTGSLRRRAVDRAKQVIGFDVLKIHEEEEFVIIARIPDRFGKPGHRALVIRGLKFNVPVSRLFHSGRDRMKSRHIDAGPPHQGLFADAAFPESDILGGGRNNVHKKALVFLVRAGKQPANRINSFVLLFEEGAQIGICAALGRVIHTVRIWVNTVNG